MEKEIVLKDVVFQQDDELGPSPTPMKALQIERYRKFTEWGVKNGLILSPKVLHTPRTRLNKLCRLNILRHLGSSALLVQEQRRIFQETQQLLQFRTNSSSQLNEFRRKMPVLLVYSNVTRSSSSMMMTMNTTFLLHS